MNSGVFARSISVAMFRAFVYTHGGIKPSGVCENMQGMITVRSLAGEEYDGTAMLSWLERLKEQVPDS